MGDLTNKQRAFIEEYLVDFNATRAAERAGYSGDDTVLASVGCENLRKPKIAERIAQRMRAKAMTADEALMRLAEQARQEQAEYYLPDGTVDFERLLADGKGHLVKGTKWDRAGNLVVEFYDGQAALALIGKHLTLFREHVNVEERQIDMSTLSNEQLERLANGEPLERVLASGGRDD